MRQMVNHPLDPDDALRAAKAAIGGGAAGVGFQPVGFDADVGDPVAIVGVQHGTVGDGEGQILAPSAAHEVREVDGDQLAGGVRPGLVADFDVMALAGDDHVVVAVITHLAGFAGGVGCQGTGDGEGIALGFLAAKTTAHPPHFDPDGGHWQVQGMGDLVLDLGRVLG
jgi:hypothetical protein